MTLLSETPASKGDIDALWDELRTYYASKADLSDMKADISDVRADLAEMKSELVKWMIGLMIGASAAATGFAVLIERIT